MQERSDMGIVYNFSAGPAMLPYEVMQQAQKEFINWNEKGVSVAEISHRSKDFEMIAAQSTQDLRDLLSIPNHYHILFLPGGGRTQFSALPMNLLDDYHSAAYAITGFWGELAAKEAARYTAVNTVVDAGPAFTSIPDEKTWKDYSDAAYLHYVDNETIHGVEFNFIPDAKSVPLVCDMSSNFLSRQCDVSKFGVIYACAQKNISIAGVTIVIVRDDLLSRKKISTIPTMLDYSVHAKHNSLYNTVPTYPWYLSGLTFQWLKRMGGVTVVEKQNKLKAEKLYQYLDSQTFYQNNIDHAVRSRMNVIFKCPTPELDAIFVEKALDNNLYGLKGHRVLGGIRASIYNAMPIAGVEKLVEFMNVFSHQYA